MQMAMMVMKMVRMRGKWMFVIFFVFGTGFHGLHRFMVFCLPSNPGFPSEMSTALDFGNFTGQAGL